jgi:hypothetical protein
MKLPAAASGRPGRCGAGVLAQLLLGRGPREPLLRQRKHGHQDVHQPRLPHSGFLLSFDKGEKYVPQNGQHLIHCHPRYGPIFGAGSSDLFIADGCDANTNSYASFPHTYNREGSNKIVQSQQSYTDFSGAIVGYNFRVVEYEVFQVLFK